MEEEIKEFKMPGQEEKKEELEEIKDEELDKEVSDIENEDLDETEPTNGEEKKEEAQVDVEKIEDKESAEEETKSETEKLYGKEGGEMADVHIFALRTTANREDQVMDFLTSNVQKKKLDVYCVIRPHGMRGYIFLEAKDRQTAEEAAFNVPYARGILPKEVKFDEIEHMLEKKKKEINMQKNDVCEIISGPFKREKAKVTRIDAQKEEVIVELLEAAVPIPITLKIDAVKVIRREDIETEE
jgi:transcription termination/antitermination protein NusG